MPHSSPFILSSSEQRAVMATIGMWLRISDERMFLLIFESVLLGHHEVGDDEVGHDAQSLFDALFSVSCIVEVEIREYRTDIALYVVVVLDNENYGFSVFLM